MKSLSKKRFGRFSKLVLAVIACGGIPFFFFHGVLAELLLKVYLLTALLLYVLLLSNWEAINEIWFWKAMIPIVALHSVVVFGLWKLNVAFPWVDRVPRAAYGALTVLLTGEVLVSIRLIAACRPVHSDRPPTGLRKPRKA